HQTLEDPRDAVLRDAELARTVMDGDLRDAVAPRRGEHGYEAVQLAVEVNVGEGFAAVGLEAAIVVVEVDAGEPARQGVEAERWPAFVPGVFAVDLPTTDHVVAPARGPE